MAIIGCLGDIIFTVSDEMVKTLTNWSWSGSVRYAVHNRHNYHAMTEFTGIDPDKVTFEIKLDKSLGVNPMEDVVKLWWYERDGEALPLTIGTTAYGKYRWVVVSHDVKIDSTDAVGNVIAVTVNVTLQEYLNV